MAKKNKKPKAPKLTQEQKDIQRLREEVGIGKGIADDLGLQPGGLGRVDETLPSFGADPNILNVGEMLARLRAESFSGGYNSPQQDEALGILGDLARTSGNRTAETAEVIDRRRQNLDTAGETPEDLANIQRLYEDEYNRSRDIDSDTQLALDRSRAGLGGLTSEENQALLETLTTDARRGFSGAQRAIAGSGLSSGAGANPALLRSLVDDYTKQQFGARNDILVRNADVQDRRLGAFSDLSRAVDSDRFARAQTTLGNYGDYSTGLNDLVYKRGLEALGLFEQSVAGAETDEFNRAFASGQAYNAGTEANVQNNRADRMARLQNYQDELFRTRQDNFQRVTTNINTNAAELSARTGVALGVPAYLEGVRSSREANELAKKQISALGSGGGGGEEHSSGNSGSGGDTFDAPRSSRTVGGGGATL